MRPLAQVVALSHVTLEVADLGRTIAFYSEVFGLEIFHDDRADPRHPSIKGVVGGIGFELEQATQPAEGCGGRTILSFAVDNLQAVFETLKAKGVIEIDQPTDRRGIRFLQIRDPDGRTVELIQFPSPLRVLGDLRG